MPTSALETETASRRPLRGLAGAEEPILEELARHFYLTAEQLQRLRYGKGSLRHAQERLRSLTEAGYLIAVERPPSQRGKTARIYALHITRRAAMRCLAWDMSCLLAIARARRPPKAIATGIMSSPPPTP